MSWPVHGDAPTATPATARRPFCESIVRRQARPTAERFDGEHRSAFVSDDATATSLQPSSASDRRRESAARTARASRLHDRVHATMRSMRASAARPKRWRRTGFGSRCLTLQERARRRAIHAERRRGSRARRSEVPGQEHGRVCLVLPAVSSLGGLGRVPAPARQGRARCRARPQPSRLPGPRRAAAAAGRHEGRARRPRFGARRPSRRNSPARRPCGRLLCLEERSERAASRTG